MSKESKELSVWKKRLSDRSSKGTPVTEWCKSNGFTKHQYYYWNRKVNNPSIPDEAAFTDITEKYKTSGDHTEDTRIEQYPDYKIQLNNLVITVPDNFNAATLAELMKVLQKL